MNTGAKRPFAVWLLVAMLAVLAVGALYGGTLLLSDPTGAALRLSYEFIRGTPFGSYLIPGLVLFTALGLGSMIVIPGLLAHRARGSMLGYRWPWIGALCVAIAFIIWMGVQIAVVGYRGRIQGVYAVYALLMLYVVLLPSVRRAYAANG